MRACARILFLAALVCAACSPTVDLSKGLEVLDVSTGWFDAGIVNGQNKLVPAISFKLKNVSNQTLSVLQINALFRRVGEKEEWGSGFLTVVGSEGLAPGATTPVLTVRSQNGYTGADQTREDMLHNSQFVDAEIEFFAKYGSTQWKRIGEYVVSRRLITK
jgi:hypothetical protein